ncbi:hypothetical protein JJB09_11265 [Rhizobium sp. KVB221]|uniref:Uncharacterized protein n=1 Tax=Rhizobium setariae TaxID=2801340 RepID=A0A937CQ65_9HYPH|nr:hypothetical protein [Rhizobium setariae]MBL0372607.1 hypothetical protein [Rhizobium setariae]
MTDDIPESHKQQISEARRQSLIRAGIPVSVHDMSLSTLGEDVGKQISDWLTDPGYTSLKSGGVTWALDLRSNKALLTTQLTARVLHIRGLGCKVVHLGRLIRMVETRDYDGFEDLMTPQALFVLDFYYAATKPTERDFSGYQRRQIQDLLTDRVGANKSNVLQICNPHKLSPRLADWWEQPFLDGANLRTLEVKA